MLVLFLVRRHIMGKKVNKVCSLDYNPLVSQPRARAPRVPTDARARAGRFPSLSLSARLSLRLYHSEERRDWDRWWYGIRNNNSPWTALGIVRVSKRTRETTGTLAVYCCSQARCPLPGYI